MVSRRKTGGGEEKAGKGYASFGDVYHEARRMQGEQISPRDLLDSGKEFVVHRYVKRPSQFQEQTEYVSVQIQLLEGKKEMRYFNSASEPLRDQLDRTAQRMPFKAKLATKKSGAGRKYVTLE